MTILEHLLPTRFNQTGLYLKQRGLFLYLMRGDKILKEWLVESVTVREVVDAADQILMWDNSGISFEKVSNAD